jgi:hypothetical protein
LVTDGRFTDGPVDHLDLDEVVGFAIEFILSEKRT